MKPQQPIPYIGSKTECKEQPIAFPPQHQNCQPGLESLMSPRPISEDPAYRGSGKLDGKVAIVTGGRQRHRQSDGHCFCQGRCRSGHSILI